MNHRPIYSRANSSPATSGAGPESAGRTALAKSVRVPLPAKLKFAPTFTEVRLEQPVNMLSMNVTEDVSNDERSREVRLEHPSNMR